MTQAERRSRELGDERLRALFADVDGAVTDACPTPERIFDAVDGALAEAEIADVLDHVGGCDACIEAWRLAAAARAPAPTSISRRRAAWVSGALLAVAAAAALLLWWRAGGENDQRPVYRGDASPIAALVADGATLQRDRVELAWRPVDDVVGYRVVVTTESLAPLASTDDLQVARFRVPADALSGLAAGARILWRVEATRQDGSLVRSHTFAFRLSK